MMVDSDIDGAPHRVFKRFVVRDLSLTWKGYWVYQLGGTEDGDTFVAGAWFSESLLRDV